MLVARVAAAVALLLFFLGTAAILMAGPHTEPLPQADVTFITTRLVDLDQSVRTQLVRLGPEGSLAAARRRTREVVAQINALTRAVQDASGTTARRLRVAIAGELRFLDAVGSVLLNPRSPRLADLPALDLAARRALAALDGPPGRRKGGVSALQRLRGKAAPQPAVAD
jgi:hypothetical protein